MGGVLARLRKQCLGDKNIIGEKVAKERKRKGMSQKDFLGQHRIIGKNKTKKQGCSLLFLL